MPVTASEFFDVPCPLEICDLLNEFNCFLDPFFEGLVSDSLQISEEALFELDSSRTFQDLENFRSADRLGRFPFFNGIH